MKPESATGWAGTFTCWLAAGGVWALTIARPVYENIAIGPEALTDLGIRRWDLVLLILLVSLLFPTIIALVNFAIGRFAGSRGQAMFTSLVLAILVGLFCWQQVSGSGMAIRLLLPLAVTGVFTWGLLRSRFLQNFVLILGIALPVVIVAFLVKYPVWQDFGPHRGTEAVPALSAETPVVMVIFDELPLASLENSRGRIDGRLFPNFAALARKSDWYPGMRAVGDQTLQAVPAVISGMRPTEGYSKTPPPPGLPQHPDNVCSLAAAGGYQVHSYEPVTDLCHRSLGLGSRLTAALRRGVGASGEVPGVNLAPADLAVRLADRLGAHFQQPWGTYDAGRQGAVDQFIAGMPAADQSLSLLHITLPHVEWTFMPDGTNYVSNRFAGVDSLVSPPSRAQITHDMQQHLLQLAFTDRELGRVITRMKELGTWGKALFIVTADHGAGFIPGGSRRILGKPNSGWILPIPLLVKFPGQKSGRVVPGGANSLDIAATVYQTLGIEPPSGANGESLLGKRRLPARDEDVVHGLFGPMTLKERQVARLFTEARRQRNATFGGGQLFALAGHRGLLGRKPSTVDGLSRVNSIPDDAYELAHVDTSGLERPSYLKATVTSGAGPGMPVAVALNGTIVATTTTWSDQLADATVAGVNLPDGDFRSGENTVQLYDLSNVTVR